MIHSKILLVLTNDFLIYCSKVISKQSALVQSCQKNAIDMG